jgi:hypothetical protein
MKKIMKYLLIIAIAFSFLGCSGSNFNYKAMIEELEEQGYSIEGVESSNYGLTISKNTTTITYVLMDGTVGMILYKYNEFGVSNINGIVYLNDEETEKSLDVDEDALESYKATVEDMGYTEELMIEFVEWFYNENS